MAEKLRPAPELEREEPEIAPVHEGSLVSNADAAADVPPPPPDLPGYLDGLALGDEHTPFSFSSSLMLDALGKAGGDGSALNTVTGALPSVDFGETPSVRAPTFGVGGVDNIAFDGSSVTLGLPNDEALSFGASITDRTAEVLDASGEVVGSYLDTGWSLNAGADGRISNSLLLSASVGHEESTRVLASLDADGNALDREALERRAAMLEDRDVDLEDAAAASDEVTALIAEVGQWGAGDSVRTVEANSGSMGLARTGLVGMGIRTSEETSEERVVEALGEGRVRVTMTETETNGGGVTATAGYGALAAGVNAELGESATQTVEFDLNTPEGQRDYALNHFSGLMPGAAEALGITTLEDAQAFIANGGMEGLDSWDRLPDDFQFGSTAELNADLLTQARDVDSDFAANNGYVSTRDSEERAVTHSLGLLGINLASARSETSTAETFALEDGRPVHGFEGTSEYSQNGFLFSAFDADGRDGSRMVADTDGRFVGTYFDTFEDNARGAEGPFAEAYRNDPAVRDAFDDPTYVHTVEGDLRAFADAYEAMDVTVDASADRALDLVVNAFGGDVIWVDGPFQRVSEQLDAMAAEAGVTPQDLISGDDGLGARLAAVQTGDADIATLSPEEAQLYMGVSAYTSPEMRFHAMAQLAGHPNPAVGAQAMAELISTGGSEVIDQFASWLEANPELEDTVSINEVLLAGSTDMRTAVGSTDPNRGMAAATSVLDGLEGSGLQGPALEQALAGLDITGAGAEAGGLERLYDALPVGERARFLELAGNTEQGRSLVLELAGSRPEMLIDPDVPEADRVAWAEQNLAPILGEDFDAAGFVAGADASQDRALRAGDARGLGPLEHAVWSGFNDNTHFGGAEGMTRFAEVARDQGFEPGEYARELLTANPYLAQEILNGFHHEDNAFVAALAEQLQGAAAEYAGKPDREAAIRATLDVQRFWFEQGWRR